jgi:hypothetical protein
MGIHGKIADSGEQVLSAGVLVKYELLEDCILSGQVPDGELQALIREDPAFARWLKSRVTARIRERELSHSNA